MIKVPAIAWKRFCLTQNILGENSKCHGPGSFLVLPCFACASSAVLAAAAAPGLQRAARRVDSRMRWILGWAVFVGSVGSDSVA